MSATIGSFGTFEAPVKTNPYAETMKAFVKAADANPDAAWTVELDAEKETAQRVLIAEAAHAVNKTARLRSRDDSNREIVGQRAKTGNPIYKGTVSLTFTLTEKHKPRRGGEKK